MCLIPACPKETAEGHWFCDTHEAAWLSSPESDRCAYYRSRNHYPASDAAVMDFINRVTKEEQNAAGPR